MSLIIYGVLVHLCLFPIFYVFQRFFQFLLFQLIFDYFHFGVAVIFSLISMLFINFLF